MATQKLFVFLSRKMVFPVRVLWVSVFTYLFTLFDFIRQYFSRNSNSVLIQPQEDNQTDENMIEDDRNDDFGEEGNSDSFLKFHFQTYEEFIANSGESLNVEEVHSTNNEVHTNFEFEDYGVNTNSIEDMPQIRSEIVGSQIDTVTNYADQFFHFGSQISSENVGKFAEENEKEESPRFRKVKNEEELSQSGNYLSNHEDILKNAHFLIDDESLVSDSDSDSMVSSSKFSFKSSLIDSISDGFLSDIDFERAFEVDNSMEFDGEDVKSTEKSLTEEDIELQKLSRGYETDDFEDEDEEILEELKNLEEPNSENGNGTFDQEHNFESKLENHQNGEKPNSEEQSKLSRGYETDDFEDEDEEILQELKNLEEPNSENGNGTFDQEQQEHNLESKLENHQNGEKPNSGGQSKLSRGYETDDFEDEDEEILEQLKNLEETNSENGNGTFDQEHNLERKLENNQNGEKPISGEQLSVDFEDQNGLETEWEHQDLVEQLKMEIKKVRAIGLPTILEDSEIPKIMDDLKPWKIEDKFQHEGTMDELHKFYKSYRERMRKLDILNYQKMYAIGFLRLKDPLQSFTKNKISSSSMATIVSLDCWPCKPKLTTITSEIIQQPVMKMKKLSRELESELEMVYVGQMCLSWEFIQWEYGKALELWDSDPHGIRRYNHVAEKFQHFQVLLTRFLEDEPFQAPRVQHYVKTRCVLRNLLQVPLIRDDSLRDRKKERNLGSSKDAITSVQLVEMIEESIRIFWQFIRADKYTTNAVLIKCRRRVSNIELQNQDDVSLLAEVRSSLQKVNNWYKESEARMPIREIFPILKRKEKKLKELSRGENCILRKFQKHQDEDSSDNVLHFFSIVDLKLVSRVLNMSKISTEQLVWCRDKLGKIHIVGRKLHVEPSFLLFPCA